MNGIDRLLMLQQENNEAGLQLAALAPRFQALANRHLEGTAPKAITGFNLFQTPRSVAASMAELARERIGDGARILEPSAGLGRLHEPLENLRAEWLMVEDQLECCKALRQMLKHDIINDDFLSLNENQLGGKFDAVIMNPPFKQGTDIKHINHALSMLRDGGRLVSLCYNGVKQNKHLRPFVDSWTDLEPQAFKDEGTNAAVSMIVIDK